MPALFLIFLQTFHLDFFGIGIDEGLSRFHRGLDARIVPTHDLVVFIALVRPDNHAVVVNVGAVVADAVQVFGRHAVVADDGARVFFSEDLVHPFEVGSQFVGCQQLAVFFGKPAFDVGRNGAVAFSARLLGQFADTLFVEYAVFAFARRIGFDQLTFVNQEHFGEFIGSQVGFADVVHAVVDDEIFGMGGEGGQ